MATLKIRQGEVYTATYPLKFTVHEADGTTAVNLVETTMGVYLRDRNGIVTSLVGAITGSSWDDPINGRFHATMTAAQSGAMATNEGDYYAVITLLDGAVRKTTTERMVVLPDWD